ncbi:YkvI family membrane protein [Anaerotruncus rubiinfantis]|uniref:YkvI family membrane protein n=1 Tax=Anaerotruncus rubiinfantis TaxID=1720200 RepID=UPI00082B40D1|nr:hypothetical protein [Anaerotruncus rubiinfantis]
MTKGMSWKNFHIGKVLFLGGAYCALSAGSGFGSGQELTQYFVVHGPSSLIGLWITQIITLLFGVMLIMDTRKYGLKSLDDVYQHYCGKVIGKIVWVFNIAYLLGMAAVMIAGAGANFAQYFNMDSTIPGRILMSIVVFITCLLGLKKLLNVNGVLGPIIIAFVLLISVLSLVFPSDGIALGAEFISKAHGLAVSENPFISNLLYTTMCILFQAPYWHGCAANDPNTTEDTVGSCVIGSLVFISVQTVSVLAMIANASTLNGVQVPNLALGQRFSPIIAALFGLILMFAIYTTTIPMVWSFTNAFAEEKTKKYSIIIAGVVVVSFIISGFGAFDALLNIVLGACGYFAVLYVFPFLYTRFIRKPVVPDVVPELVSAKLMKESASK